MKSMTGFGRAVVNADTFDASIDVSSVNRKGLEVSVNLPREWQAMERPISAKVKEHFSRGKVQISVKVNFKTCSGVFSINEQQLSEAVSIFKRACEKLGVEYIANSETILHVNSLLPRENPEQPDWDEYWKSLEPAIEDAMRAIDKMRETEGGNLAADFKNRLATLAEYLDEIKASSRDTPANYKDQLLLRLKTLGLDLDPNDERILKEIAVFCDKVDISEETTRLESHIGQFLNTIDSTENNGRKMDFMCQEIGREINTIGSKANNFNVSTLVINFKNELERIREQVQNVE